MPFTVAVYMVRAFLAAAAAAKADIDPSATYHFGNTTGAAAGLHAGLGAAGVHVLSGPTAVGDGASDEARIGRLTGLLAAAYSFAQFTTSYGWGVFSSRFGRKVGWVGG